LTRKGFIDVDVRDWLDEKTSYIVRSRPACGLFGVLICGGYGIWSHTNVVNFSITVQLSCLINRVQHIHTDVSKTCPQYERDMYVFRGGGVLHMENGEACAEILMNGHWEELIGKVEELFDATDDPDNYHMHI